ncbi:hypothetical protein WJX75_002220 [Coccomyxa subellipsoidea]|uniref:BCNT-C domain-containing protein n=1 Tax=Coccomyxa subellipsoidea TaxID=248742 RepID=A0ABR2YXL0_9CHLO
MANIVNAPDLPSEDEEDDDYDPTRDPDAEKYDANGKKTKTAGGRLKRARGQGATEEEDADEDDDGELDEQRVAAPNSIAATKKAKVNALWNQLQQGGKAADSAGASTSGRPAALTWGALCRPVPKEAPKQDKNRNWMLQLGFKGTSQSSPGGNLAATQAEIGPSTDAASGTRQGSDLPASQPQINGQVPEPKAAVSAAAAAIAAAKAAASATSAASNGKVAVTETRRFAGKNIEMTKNMSAAEAQAEAEKQKRNKAGLDAVLASLQAAKKVNVLDKSRSDWDTFKQSDTKVEEELEAYKKSGDKYLDKVDFLKRSELREYEKERDARLSGDVRSRGRL